MTQNYFLGAFLGLLFSAASFANTAAVPLEKANIDPYDNASRQRGAAIFMNYCSGCHSLQYTRFDAIAKGIGLVDTDGKIQEALVKTHLEFTGDKLSDAVKTSMPASDAAKWFGTPPPDLTLVARVRGADWLYSYLKGFYKDPSRPWGVNNTVFPNVGMPHVLEPLQGLAEGIYETHDEHSVLVGLAPSTKPGMQTAEAYDQTVRDLVNFLDYVGEPAKQERKRLGVWVLLFLTVFLVFAALLKREYWKDVH